MNQPPNDRRHFVHKKLLGIGKFAIQAGVQTFVPGGSAVVGIGRHLIDARSKDVGKAVKFGSVSASGLRLGPGESSPGVCDHPRTRDPVDGICKFGGAHIASIAETRRVKFGTAASFAPGSPTGGCCPGLAWVLSSNGQCRHIVSGQVQPQVPCNGRAPSSGPAPTGDGIELFHHPPSHHHPMSPLVMPGQRLRCPKRYVLGIDDMCYFGLPRNSRFRKWRPGRKPLFTGGDLNAITTAGKLADKAEEIFKDTNPAKKAVARNYRANWRKPLKK